MSKTHYFRPCNKGADTPRASLAEVIVMQVAYHGIQQLPMQCNAPVHLSAT